MNVKDILNDPNGCIMQRWGSIAKCENSANIIETAHSINLLINEQKTVKTHKQQCSKQFKTATDDPEKVNALKQQMQAISERLKSLDEDRKAKEKHLSACFDATADRPSSIPSLPQQFNQSANRDEAGGAPQAITITLAEDKDAASWNQYVDQHNAASLYHHYGWKGLIESTFNHQSHHFVARNHDQKIVGLLPTTRLKSRLFGDFGVSMPYFNYGGVLADSPSVSTELLKEAARFYQDLGCSHLEVRTTQADLIDWPASTDKVSMIRPLPDTPSELDQQLGSKIRAQIKRAQRENTQTLVGGLELLDQFYDVFATNMRDLGTPVYSKTLFANILSQWPQQATIVVIQINGQPVATAFLLGHRDMLEIPWASTLKKVNPLSINMLLYWEVLSFAIAQKYQFFDFGRSSKDHNTYRFKRQWGAKPVQHQWYYWLREGQAMPALKPDNPKFKLAIHVWQQLPVFLTRIIGPFIVKNLP